MAWTKIDDQLHSHPKILAAWARCRASLGLHLMALSYCGNYDTDGVVHAPFVEQKLPRAPERRKAVETLVAVGLWDRRGDGEYEIHDYLAFNPSRAEAEAYREEQRRKKAEAGRKGAAARYGTRHSNEVAPAKQVPKHVPPPVPGEELSPVPVPVPTTTSPTDVTAVRPGADERPKDSFEDFKRPSAILPQVLGREEAA